MEQSGVTQIDLAKEWETILGRTKYQTGVSNELKKDKTDSISFIQAVSNLTKLPISDIFMELTYSTNYNRVVYTSADGESEQIPVSNSLRAAASSLLSVTNQPEGIDSNTEFISVPKTFIKPGGVKMLVRITGESMTPTFQPDDYVACRLMEQYDWNILQDDHVYLIVTKENETHLKRIKNRLNEHGLIRCYSDSMDKNQYPEFNVETGEIMQIWKVVFSLSWSFPDPHGDINEKFKSIDSKLIDQDYKIRQLFEEMKKLRS
jgi:hypothetical protein